MTKLHEILAVDKDREREAKLIYNETINMWKKANYFSSMHKTLEMFDDNRQQEVEAFEEKTAMVTTVPTRLEYTLEFVKNHLDILYQKEATNQHACADIIIDSKTIAKDVPATMLLGLERELGKLRLMFLTIPTLDASVEWVHDPDTGDNVFKAVNLVKAHKTEKTMKIITLAEATTQHKEQVATQNQDTIVGQYVTKKWSGMITSAQKATLLKKFDTLLSGIKQARMRANETVVADGKIGDQLFKYILN